jgi:hypothetical protein
MISPDGGWNRCYFGFIELGVLKNRVPVLHAALEQSQGLGQDGEPVGTSSWGSSWAAGY